MYVSFTLTWLLSLLHCFLYCCYFFIGAFSLFSFLSICYYLYMMHESMYLFYTFSQLNNNFWVIILFIYIIFLCYFFWYFTIPLPNYFASWNHVYIVFAELFFWCFDLISWKWYIYSDLFVPFYRKNIKTSRFFRFKNFDWSPNWNRKSSSKIAYKRKTGTKNMFIIDIQNKRK